MMNKPPFKVGDVVRLNSGSPPLTVDAVEPAEYDVNKSKIRVTWIHDGRPNNAWFPSACVHKEST